jgi:hypothetical protein
MDSLVVNGVLVRLGLYDRKVGKRDKELASGTGWEPAV